MSIDDFEVGEHHVIEENEKTLFDHVKFLISILWQYRLFIIIFTSFGAALSVAYSIVTLRLPPDINPMPNIYQAYTQVLIQEGNTGGDNYALMLDMLGMGGAGSQAMTKGELAQMVYQSYPFADGIVNKFGLNEKFTQAQNPKTASRRYFYRNSSFAYDSRSGELVISFIDTDKYLATEIVVFMLEELQRWFHEQGGAVSESQIVNIESKLYEVSTEINRLEEQIKGMQLEYGVLNIDELAIAQQALVNSLNEQIMNLDLLISQQENTQSSYSPVEQGSVRELKGQREDVVNTLERLEAGLPVGSKVYPPANELPNIALEFKQLQLLYEIQSGIYLSLTEQYEMLKLSKGGALSFTVLEPAEVPEEKIGPIRSKICINVTMMSFVFSILLVVLIHILRNYKYFLAKVFSRIN